ncbi:IclR family transcriptional regulator C-terminal domain-containing protein [Fodinisporobacter ferrooxydans]|uniref:IclR family transcriptional regulator C-terminal domain-containing protein n=1 Tax=Fodinisporobacter ferrooxydans TaxID=2901836 RepID=A0ABY4CKU7_9BACL|nr:IclR family transcriptional regulator C-terminal domain-containing protein [Alicyclobacillaceae bacterium MYW30-H2]
MHATASGKILLSYSSEDFVDSVLTRELPAFTERTITDPITLRQELSKIRSAEFAVDDEELSVGLMCISVPVFFGEGQIGALSVSGPKQRITQKLTIAEIVRTLRHKSECITEKLRFGKKVRISPDGTFLPSDNS